MDHDTPAEKLEIELDENVHRKDFSPEELVNGYRRLDKLRRPGFVKRIGMAVGMVFRRLFRLGRKPRSRRDIWSASRPRGDTAPPANSI